VLGIEGLALMRQWLTGDPEAIEARVREIAELCDRFHNPLESDAFEADEVDASAGYEVLAETYDAIENALIVAEEEHVYGLLDRLALGRVLDAACGTGRHSQYLVSRGHDVIGVDESPAMLSRAREKVAGDRFVQGSLQALPFAGGSFDAVVCALALTHVDDMSLAIAELARLVRTGGTVIISDIHPLAALTGAHLIVTKRDGELAVIRNNIHFHSRYINAFAEHGLEVLSCTEPEWDTARFAPGGIFAEFMEAAQQGVDGLPWVLIWHLKKAAE
jgi:ubiquinone/menaquinone biosynthesis C-methylase UbiE